jgi:Flp pilus assembly protein TadG
MHAQRNGKSNPVGPFGRCLGTLARRLAGFLGDRRGNVAMIFGITFIPILVAGGSGVDLARAFIVQQRLAHALDAAALAVGTSLEKTDAELEALAQSFFDANYPAQEMGVPGALAMAINDNVITLSASAEVDTAFMRVVGYNEMSVGATSEVTRKLTGLEVVLVLDNTGSMGSGGKITALKSASKELVNILFGDQTNPDYLKIGLVPFSAAVNVGTQYLNSGWIDTTGASSVNGLNFSNGRHAMQIFNTLTNKSWNGCVEARPMPMDVDDTPPSAGNPDTLWVPYFAPDEPDNGWDYGYSYNNNYLSDGTTNSNLQIRQARYQKYTNKSVWGDGPHYNCKIQPITPLTNDKQDILDAIDDMVATGNTNISFGMAWGWRVVSPTEPFTEGTAYNDKKFRKAIILLTDGDNVIGQKNNHNKSEKYFDLRRLRLCQGRQARHHQRLDRGRQARRTHVDGVHQHQERLSGPADHRLYDHLPGKRQRDQDADEKLRHRPGEVFRFAVERRAHRQLQDHRRRAQRAAHQQVGFRPGRILSPSRPTRGPVAAGPMLVSSTSMTPFKVAPALALPSPLPLLSPSRSTRGPGAAGRCSCRVRA